MRVSYDKLWHMLLSRHMTKEVLRKECGISSNTIAKLGKGQNVTTDVLVRICKVLKCDISDVMEIIQEEDV